MSPPPKYPRIPHLVARTGMDSDDHVLEPAARRNLLSAEVIVEEKLDGANIAIWIDDGAPQAATRGGVGAVDRSGHLGRIRAWIGEHADDLRAALGERRALYAEWLLLRHRVGYDRLPAPLVGLDLLDRSSQAFLELHDRDVRLAQLEIPLPPRLFCGVLGTIGAAERLTGARRSATRPPRASSSASGTQVRACPAPQSCWLPT